MPTTIPDTSDSFKSPFASFDLSTAHARIFVESEGEYQGNDDLRVRLTDNNDAHILLSAAEALSVAAALQAVAVHLLETSERSAA